MSEQNDVVSDLNWRYATKAFDPTKTIPAATWTQLEQSLILSPSSFGMQPWRFVVVTDKAVKAKLLPLSWNQPQVTDCSHFVVLARKRDIGVADVDKLLNATYAARGIPPGALDGYRGMMVGFVNNPSFDAADWAARQVYIALGFLMHTAAVLHVDACPMEGISPGGFDELLGLPAEGYMTTVACALGYRSAGDKYAKGKKVRYPASELVRHV